MEPTTAAPRSAGRLSCSDGFHRRRRSLSNHAGAAVQGPRMFDEVKSADLCTWISSAGPRVARSSAALRTAPSLDWANTSIMFGQDKPIISPRDPDSLAQVGYSPLTAPEIRGCGSRRCGWSKDFRFPRTADCASRRVFSKPAFPRQRPRRGALSTGGRVAAGRRRAPGIVAPLERNGPAGDRRRSPLQSQPPGRYLAPFQRLLCGLVLPSNSEN